MKRIRGWEASDGTGFDRREDAELHECRLELEAWLEGQGVADPKALALAVIEDAARLKRLLGRFAPVRRPRKKTDPELKLSA